LLELDKLTKLDHEWKNNFFIQCLTPMLEAMVSVQSIEYAHILNLDKTVRDFGVPSLLDDHQANDINPRFLVMQRGLVSMGREIGKDFSSGNFNQCPRPIRSPTSASSEIFHTGYEQS
jgi:hypothetical protein